MKRVFLKNNVVIGIVSNLPSEIPGSVSITAPGADTSVDVNEQTVVENGYSYNVEQNIFVEPNIDPITFVPTTVSMRQARLALLELGLLNDVNTAINSISDEMQRAAAQIEWEYGNTVERNSQLIQSLAPALNLTNQQIDDLFTRAAQL